MHFGASQNIQSIRLNWDQGSLLKQIDVIGARARAWPIRDGKDQIRLIASSAARHTQSNGSLKSATTNGQSHKTSPSKGSRSGNNTATSRDPHTSLEIFAPRDEAEDESSRRPAAAAPKSASARPPPRDYGDLFAGEETEAPRPASPQKENRPLPKTQTAKPEPRDYHDLFVGPESDASPASKGKLNSPLKNITSPIPTAPKGGAGKNFQPMRLFENIGTEASNQPQAHKAPNPKKYGHFEFGDGDEDPSEQRPLSAKAKTQKHQSQWDFQDFMTPEKVRGKSRPNETRHFALDEDESVKNSPVKNAVKVTHPRPDARTQFEFQDDGASAGQRRPGGQPRGNVQAHAKGLYQDNSFDDEVAGQSTEMGKKDHPLATVTNLQQRGRAFDHQFNIQDQPSPAANNNDAKKIPENRNKVVKTMEPQWEATDMSPAPSERKGKENFPTAAGAKNIGIKSGGDGMGGKNGGGRGWGIGDESGGEEGAVTTRKQIVAGRTQQMGGNRSWSIGDESDGEGAAKKYQPQRKQLGQGRSDEWDF